MKERKGGKRECVLKTSVLQHFPDTCKGIHDFCFYLILFDFILFHFIFFFFFFTNFYFSVFLLLSGDAAAVLSRFTSLLVIQMILNLEGEEKRHCVPRFLPIRYCRRVAIKTEGGGDVTCWRCHLLVSLRLHIGRPQLEINVNIFFFLNFLKFLVSFPMDSGTVVTTGRRYISF